MVTLTIIKMVSRAIYFSNQVMPPDLEALELRISIFPVIEDRPVKR
jgi:hypothetical protein